MDEVVREWEGSRMDEAVREIVSPDYIHSRRYR